MLCTIWYQLRNVKNTHGGMLPLLKLQALACNLLKVTLLHRWFSSFLYCTNGTKSRNTSHMDLTKKTICFKGTGSCIDLLLTNQKYSFKNVNTFEADFNWSIIWLFTRCLKLSRKVNRKDSFIETILRFQRISFKLIYRI